MGCLTSKNCSSDTQNQDGSEDLDVPTGSSDLMQDVFGNDWLQSLLPGSSTSEDVTTESSANQGAAVSPPAPAQTTSKSTTAAPTAYDKLLNQEVAPTTRRWRKMSDIEKMEHDLNEAIFGGLQLGAPGQGEDGFVHEVDGELYVYDQGMPGVDTTVADMVGPNASQFIGRAFAVNDGPPDASGQQKKKLVTLNPDGTVGEQQANDQGFVQLPGASPGQSPGRPTPFLGYKSYNMNDVSNTVNGKAVTQEDQYASPENMAKIVNLALDYQTMFPDSCLEIGDISTDTGNTPNQANDTKPHKSHFGGSQLDLRYVKGKDAQIIGKGTPKLNADDKLRTEALMKLAEGQGFNNFILGTALQGQFDKATGSKTRYLSDHNNHMHFGLGDGTAEQRAYLGTTAGTGSALKKSKKGKGTSKVVGTNKVKPSGSKAQVQGPVSPNPGGNSSRGKQKNKHRR